jgi:uncharacterized membrane protein YkvA (DUF1232 family)
MNESDFSKHYSDQGFWEKVGSYALTVGKEGIRNALILYFTLQDPEGKVPTWAKTVIIGALAYFIWPLDAIPDITPVVGYVDDIGVLAAAVAAVAVNIPPEARRAADEKLKGWFN